MAARLGFRVRGDDDIDGDYLIVQQDKNRNGTPPRIVVIPVRDQFKAWMDRIEHEAEVDGLSTAERSQHHILLSDRDLPWASPNSFSGSFARMARLAGIEDRTFHDLRGTAITRLARAECTVPQIATITGHSLKTVQTILDKHYLHRV